MRRAARARYIAERGVILDAWTGHGFSLQSLLTPGRLDGGARARPGAARRHGRARRMAAQVERRSVLGRWSGPRAGTCVRRRGDTWW